MRRPHPRSTRSDTHIPATTLFRSNGFNCEIEPTYAHVKFYLMVTDSAGATITTNIDSRHPGYTGPPVSLDLDGDGVELVRLIDSTAAFDMDGDGVADPAGWVGQDDGFLALDRNGNGLIDDISEISFVKIGRAHV